MACFFVTHPEVVIDPAVPVEEWRLSDLGRRRASRIPVLLVSPVTRVVSSAKRKATETAAILADALDLTASVDPALGEMDRSATGYLPPEEFEPTVDDFFAHPTLSVRGWERAADAQRRIEGAVRAHRDAGHDDGVAFVAHGGVGALLLASLTSAPISRSLDQPGLGSCFSFDARAWRALSGWRRIE